MQQQQQPRDRVAAMQQMAGTSEFQPPHDATRDGRPPRVQADDRRASAREKRAGREDSPLTTAR